MEIDKKMVIDVFESTGLDKKFINLFADLAKIFYQAGYEAGYKTGSFDIIDKTIRQANKEV